LAAKGDEDQAAALAVGDATEAAGQLDQGRRTGGVVVGAVVDGTLVPVFCQAAGATVAQAVVVGADNHRLLGQRTRPLGHADHVLHGGRGPLDVDLHAGGPALQRPAVRLEVVVDLVLRVAQARVQPGP